MTRVIVFSMNCRAQYQTASRHCDQGAPPPITGSIGAKRSRYRSALRWMSASRTVASARHDDDRLPRSGRVDGKANAWVMPRPFRLGGVGQPRGHVERAGIAVGEHQQRCVEREP